MTVTETTPFSFESSDVGDIIIRVRAKEYPIIRVYGNRIIMKSYGAGSAQPYAINENISGFFEVDPQIITDLREDIRYPNPFDIIIKSRNIVFPNRQHTSYHQDGKFEFR